jgi:hypothetical protein
MTGFKTYRILAQPVQGKTRFHPQSSELGGNWQKPRWETEWTPRVCRYVTFEGVLLREVYLAPPNEPRFIAISDSSEPKPPANDDERWKAAMDELRVRANRGDTPDDIESVKTAVIVED